ncbi:MAG: hypothetical protein B6V02_01515 [Thermoprotei archaeon ex4572_64]|nr:MAG: hypothetical protein B6V02_01515 [Thermoprotei archaeon ex4572_64]
MFEIYKKKVTINDNNDNPITYELLPLSGKYMGKLMKLVKELSKTKDKKEDEALDAISEEAINLLTELLLETFKKSYPKEDEVILDAFVSQNMFQLIEPLMEVNLNNKQA